jgi:serine/threonine-protein kinase HipA
VTDATVKLWGRAIGAVSWDETRQLGVFQYMPEFAGSGIELAPLMMPLSRAPYAFPELPREAFKGLPGLLADSLPDKFGNALIDAWRAREGRSASNFNPVERLCYIGTRGMGALEFHPTLVRALRRSNPLEIDALVNLANSVLAERGRLSGTFTGDDDDETIQDILRVGTSAGGARAKAILAWNEETGEFRSGQIPAGEGFSYWLIKFDGVSNNRDKEVADPLGFGLIEYAYYLMATGAGIEMSLCRLHYEGGRSHFMTKRFDRTKTGQKLHMQSLAALRHFNFNAAGAYSYEQALETIRRLGLPADDLEQQFRRGVFNVLARNQDDHVKNIAFLMNRQGQWRLSPAYDLSYAHNPAGAWTQRHQMSLNGKLDDFDRGDLVAFGESAGLKRLHAERIVGEIAHAIHKWPEHGALAGVPESRIAAIGRSFRRLYSGDISESA